ncbi:MAG: PPOX class F420-dependent oxidoreductase, partial [Rubrobacteraceae bacterium]
DGLIDRRVVAITGGSGGYAGLVTVDAGGLIEVPEGLALDSATALLADGRTAKMLIQASSLREGERVLVEAAAGSVGSLLVQLARAAGATVIAAVGGARKVELARELGADMTVDYREPGWTDRIREATGGVDVVFDGVGGDIARSAFGLLDCGGRMISFGMSSGEWAGIPDEAAADRGVTKVGLSRPTPEEARAFTEDALSDAADGRLRPVIGQTFPLERAAEAHAAIESRATVGKTLLVARRPAPFTRAELSYLESQTLGRLATAQPNGTLQVSPVGFAYNTDTATIDIRGYNMASSRKFRNVADNGRAAFIVDDIASRQPWRVRCLEIRGHAESIDPSASGGDRDGVFIRVHPERIIGFGIDDPDQEVHKLTPNTRDATEPPDRLARK